MPENESSQILKTESLVALLENDFSQFTEIPSRGFNRLVKARRFGRWWMLKGLKEEYLQLDFYRQLLRKEFEITISLQHPNIATVIGFEEVKGIGPCIIMEWVDGMTLAEWMNPAAEAQTATPTKRDRCRLFNQLLDTVEYIHSMQVAHRDLKPSNILVTRNGSLVKLIDFGLSDTDSHAVLKQPAGTLEYVSPEQSIDNQTDMRNDIYSLGCILHELRLGWLYAPVVKRCKRPIEQRYANVAALRGAMRRIARIPYYIIVALMAAVIAVWLTFGSRQEQQYSRSAGQIVEERMGNMEKIVVSTAEELDRLHQYAGNPNVYVQLANDIDLTDYIAQHYGDEGWLPIGEVASFRGFFDGCGHTVKGLYVNRPDSVASPYPVGLFGYIANALIRNLTVEGTVTGSYNAGGLVGSAITSTVENCHFHGDAKADIAAGGLIGYARLINISSCSASGTVSACEEAGGLVALVEENSVVTNCHADSRVSATGNAAGGVVGAFFSTLDQELRMSRCSFHGTVEGADFVGGILGHTNGKRLTLTIADCQSECNVTGRIFVGCFGGCIIGEGLKGNIANCNAEGSVRCPEHSAGGLMGQIGMCNWFFDGTVINITDCSFQGTVEGCERVGGLIGFTHGTEDRAGKQYVAIRGCKVKAKVHGQDVVGMLVGYLGALVTVENNDATGSEATSVKREDNLLVGINDGSTIEGRK